MQRNDMDSVIYELNHQLDGHLLRHSIIITLINTKNSERVDNLKN